MKTFTVHSRPSDGRIEITNIINDYSDDPGQGYKDWALYDTDKNGRVAKFYRDRNDGYYNADLDLHSNIENRFFYTPMVKKNSYTVSVGQRYIYIS